jgi:hypothetical protein
MYRRYRQMIEDKALFDRLGVTPEQGDELPAEFLAWAREFDRIDREG